MRWNSFAISIALAVTLTITAIPSAAAGFGTVVPIGGSASDTALDESRGVLYIANFTANRIEVMSTASNTIRTSMNVPAQPGALALSPDSQFLLVAHYANNGGDPGKNLVTLINLNSDTRQTFATGDPPLGVAFTNADSIRYPSGQALIVTTTSFVILDPLTGAMSVLATFASLSTALPVDPVTFPGQIFETALTTSADGQVVWGIGGAGTGNQIIYRYDAFRNRIAGWVDVSSPSLLPRVSVSGDGSTAMIGWSLFQYGALQGRYPNVIASLNITGHAYDSRNGIIYGQFPDTSQPTGPPLAAGTGATAIQPAILIMDADNLTVRDRIIIPENMVGRAVLDSSARTLYAISESGVMVLPVGSLSQYHRVAATQEDLLVQTSFCNRGTVTQLLTITDPGGGNTDFTISPSQAGVTVSPSSGVTPATVQVRVDPSAFQGSNGTTAVTLKITSASAVNQPRPVRLLMNNTDVDQRGTVVDVPGQLSDILADPGRNRFYILRQDKNQLLIFDGATSKLITTLRTATTPTMMSFTLDNKYLLVGHDDSQLVTVYDLDALQAVIPITLPGGHYARSIAQSNGRLLVLARDESDGSGKVDTVDFPARVASALPSLGVFKNSVSPKSVLSPSPNGRSILLASPDGNVMLYSADADTFTVSRKDVSALSGAFAASSYDSFVVGNMVFNASLVPVGTLSATMANSSGFAFVDQGGYLATAASASGPGVIQKMAALQSTSVRPVRMSEAPLLPVGGTSTATGTGASTGSGNTSGTGTAGNGSGSVSLYTFTSFTRTIAPLPSAGTVVALTTSGFTVLASTYDAAVAPPSITSVVNAADGKQPVAPGGLISLYGQQMSPVNLATSQIPLPTALGQSCVSVNGAPVPLLFVSGQQINAQLPFNVAGSGTMSVHTPGGISNNFYFSIYPAAPSVFRTGAAGPEAGLATIVRADNNQFVTPTNPVHPGDTVIIYLTGMGMTTPQVDAGLPAPSNPLAEAQIVPAVSLGGSSLNVSYAGLAPGQVGVYQINASIPSGVPVGASIPLVVDQGGFGTTLNVRVVNK